MSTYDDVIQNGRRPCAVNAFNYTTFNSPDDGDISDDEDADSVESLDYIRSISPPDNERDESYKPDIWNRRVNNLSPPGN